MTRKTNTVGVVRWLAAALPLVAGTALAATYSSAVLSDGPKAYYRFNDDTNRTLINQNSGSLGAAGNATNDLDGVVHSFPGAIVGDPNRSIFFDFTTRTEIPYNAAINPPNTQPFTIEAWLYAASDQTATGMSPLANRWTQGGNRQGWVFFQRKPDSNYNGSEPVGWACRMYNDLDGSGHLEAISRVPYRVGEWQHVVVVYDPVGGDPLAATLSMYINGELADVNVNPGSVPGYAPVTGNHDPAPNGQPAMALGNYNNANGSLNPWFGAVDEFAWYSNKLSPTEILAHYQNATNANRTTPYDTLVKSHHPVVYLRLNETAPTADTAVNLGDLRNVGHGANTAEVNHPVASALAGQRGDSAISYHLRNGSSTTTIPFAAQNNPDPSVPFTFEVWLRPTNDRQNPGASPVNNRYAVSGVPNRTGWVIFQRAPNDTYTGVSGYSGVGWNFRMFSGTGGGGQDVTTGVPYTIGDWQHLVVTWEPQTDISPAGNGSPAWQGVLTAYINGSAVASNTAASYCANTDPNEDSSTPVDLGIGSYNAKSGLGSNPYEGDIDDLAIYNGFALTPDQILEHYQNGISTNPGTNYETLVYTAGLFTQLVPGRERAGLPPTYLRFNERAPAPAANSGSLGASADGNLVTTINGAAGPQAPAYAGFEANNSAPSLDGLKQWVGLNNPAGLNLSGQITIETWIKPDATQLDPARIVSHGPPTYSAYLTGPPPTDYGAPTNGNEVYLKIEGSGPYNYTVGSATFTNGEGTTYHYATAQAPAEDFGGADWVHLAGTYDGSKWRLYRNGLEIASSADAVGALPVINGDWAIGSIGNGWENTYAGGLDETAIYDKALSVSQIASHYLTGKAGTTALTISRNGNNVTITWPAGTKLQSADNVTGTYADVTGSPVSPLTIPATGTKFYRWRL